MPTKRTFTLVLLMYMGLRASEGLVRQCAHRWAVQDSGLKSVVGTAATMSLGR